MCSLAMSSIYIATTLCSHKPFSLIKVHEYSSFTYGLKSNVLLTSTSETHMYMNNRAWLRENGA
ncbi:hypothetical protein DPMN_021264 [Dreissena polymorpha]|uniref:Uncharacterized protein n=1 Tax=Dreissena polymorpha TaxID=45954 RepID=A0A9D4NKF8_DREPO|nr:hypothetical protein DPMN_021264 [Dreissena polymorpha]